MVCIQLELLGVTLTIKLG